MQCTREWRRMLICTLNLSAITSTCQCPTETSLQYLTLERRQISTVKTAISTPEPTHIQIKLFAQLILKGHNTSLNAKHVTCKKQMMKSSKIFLSLARLTFWYYQETDSSLLFSKITLMLYKNTIILFSEAHRCNLLKISTITTTRSSLLRSIDMRNKASIS